MTDRSFWERTTWEERETLRNPGTLEPPAHAAQAPALRCRIVLACAEGLSNTAVAGRLPVTIQTVGKWRHCISSGVWRGCPMSPALGLRGRSATTPSSGYSLEKRPHDATHWSTRSMAKRCGLSQNSVSLIWRAFALQPHRAETFQLEGPLFIAYPTHFLCLSVNNASRAGAHRPGLLNIQSGPIAFVT